MRYWYDTEFIEDGRTIDLISIGVVAEGGREFYAQNLECDFGRAGEWVRANVLPHLRDFDPATLSCVFEYNTTPWKTRPQLAAALAAFVGDDTPEWWGSCSAYDHVALCQLFGRMVDLPAGWPFYTNDIQQWAQYMGLPRDWDSRIPAIGTAHSALDDARWTRRAYEYLLDFDARVIGVLSSAGKATA
ncbi:MAG: 3'-5' exoribonuclease [Acidobacteriota bacterium]|nr:3'-5' exoribonuclease [Acidobacteriota bacterium]